VGTSIACEHMFVTSQGSPYSRFRRAIEGGHLLKALDAASELKRVSLEDALDLCRLLAASDDPMFAKAASRWIARLSAEKGATLSELQLAAAALGQLWEDPGGELAVRTLRGLSESARTSNYGSD